MKHAAFVFVWLVLCFASISASAELRLSIESYTTDEVTFSISGTLDTDTVADASGSPGYLAVKNDWSNNEGVATEWFNGGTPTITANTVTIGGVAPGTTVQNGTSSWMDNVFFANPAGTETPIPAGTVVSGSLTLTGAGLFQPADAATLELLSGFNRDNSDDWARLESVAYLGTLYAVEISTGSLVTFDPETFAKTSIGPLGVGFAFGGLAYDPTNDVLYMIDGRAAEALYTIDRNTGAATQVGVHGVTDLFGLAFDSANGVLYAAEGSGNGLHALDPTTGASTLIGDPGVNLDGLAYDSANDRLVGWEAGAGQLFEVDRTTGSTTLLASLGFVNNNGLTYDALRNLFWAVDYNGDLITIDPANGFARTQVASGLGAHDGLTFVPLPASGGQAEIAISPNPLDFGDQEVGTTSTASAVTISNPGTADLQVSSITAAAAPFALTGGTCGGTSFTVTAGGSCTLTYTFGPSATGTASQAFSVVSNAASSPDSFTLQGNGTQAVVSLDLASVALQASFGDTATASVTVTNSGTADLTLSDVSGLAAPFSISGGSCLPTPTTVAPGNACTIDITFDSGVSQGTFNDSFDIVSNAPSSPDTVGVQGTTSEPFAIPTLDRYGMLMMVLAMLIIGGIAMRRAA